MITGKPFDTAFAEGWAKVPHGRDNPYGSTGHFWKPAPPVKGFVPNSAAPVFKSACGLTGATDPSWRALPLGDWPACKRCLRIHPAPTAAERR